MLGELARQERPLTHSAIDELTPSKPVEHLRSVLVSTGALPERDEQLVRTERWFTETIASCPDPAHRQLLHTYAHWHLLRRLRTRNRGRMTTYGQATGLRSHLRAAVLLLDWLSTQHLNLTSCTQTDIDRWLTSDEAKYRSEAGRFLRWATTTQNTTSILDGKSFSWGGPTDLLDGEQRWAIARRLLHDDTLKPADRAAGLLVLLYGQHASTISQLTTDHVVTGPDTVQLRFGTASITLPEPVATLMRTLVNTRTGHAALGDIGTSTCLFPGGQPGRPISAAHMGVRLRGLGIRPNPAGSAALFSLAAQLPAAILSRTLGIHIDVAVTWQKASAGDWSNYAADVVTRTTNTGGSTPLDSASWEGNHARLDQQDGSHP